MSHLPRLLLVADQHRERPGALDAAVAAGAKFVQIRDKHLDSDAVRGRLQRIREVTAATLVCVNGRPELARTCGVGLHLPAAHPTVSRHGITLLGRSAHDEAEVERAVAEGVDYLIVGTVFETSSKPGRTPAGLTALARLTELAAPTPVYAIGGITPARVTAVLATGAHGVAVCSAILDVPDVGAATRRLLSELNA